MGHSPRDSLPTHMKKFDMKSLFLGGLGLAAAILQASCVTPYGEAYGPSGSVTTYQAGYETRSLPPGYRTEVIGDQSYYTHNGTYYRRGSGGYVVVEAPVTRSRGYDQGGREQVIITELPRGYRTINHNGGRYYQNNDVYYQQRGQGYVVVGSPF